MSKKCDIHGENVFSGTTKGRHNMSSCVVLYVDFGKKVDNWSVEGVGMVEWWLKELVTEDQLINSALNKLLVMGCRIHISTSKFDDNAAMKGFENLKL